MITSEIAWVYSKALYNLSSESFENRLKEFELVLSILNQENIMNFFSSPHIDRRHKQAVLKNSLKTYISPILLSFLEILLKKNFFSYLSEIFLVFKNMVLKNSNVLEVTFVAASPLNSLLAEILINKLEVQFKQKVQLKTQVTPQLLGGGILIVGNERLDFSIKSRLHALKQSLLKATA